jgi:hypothetical protein
MTLSGELKAFFREVGETLSWARALLALRFQSKVMVMG